MSQPQYLVGENAAFYVQQRTAGLKENIAWLREAVVVNLLLAGECLRPKQSHLSLSVLPLGVPPHERTFLYLLFQLNS
jgi:hypothetical protein